MLNSKMRKLFEADQNTGFLTLKKVEIDDATLMNHLGIKPTEINIILARVASFIKGDPEKAKKDLINDILEVLERSGVAREFVGLGIQQEYHLYKGFPVRHGDPYESMSEPGNDMNLKPSELYIGWSTDGAKSREDSIKYDAAKGEPIGGLLVDVHVDSSKLLFDINAVIRIVKAKKALLEQYNNKAAPGKSLSKTNIEYLSTEAPFYYGMWEIITTNQVVTVRVMDKWTWDSATGQKKVKWALNAQQQNPQQAKLKENMKALFEECKAPEIILENSSFEGLLDEAFWQGVKNFFGSLFGTTRMKHAKKFAYFIKAAENEKNIYIKLLEFFKMMGEQYAPQITQTQKLIKKADAQINSLKQQLEDTKNDVQKMMPGKNINALHAQAKEIKGSSTSDAPENSVNSMLSRMGRPPATPAAPATP